MLNTLYKKRKLCRFTIRNEEEDEEQDDSSASDLCRTANDKIFFYCDVTKKTILTLIESLKKATDFALKNDKNKIFLYIHSSGGDAFAGLSGMMHIEKNKIEVVCIVDGFVASLILDSFRLKSFAYGLLVFNVFVKDVIYLNVQHAKQYYETGLSCCFDVYIGVVSHNLLSDFLGQSLDRCVAVVAAIDVAAIPPFCIHLWLMGMLNVIPHGAGPRLPFLSKLILELLFVVLAASHEFF